ALATPAHKDEGEQQDRGRGPAVPDRAGAPARVVRRGLRPVPRRAARRRAARRRRRPTLPAAGHAARGDGAAGAGGCASRPRSRRAAGLTGAAAGSGASAAPGLSARAGLAVRPARPRTPGSARMAPGAAGTRVTATGAGSPAARSPGAAHRGEQAVVDDLRDQLVTLIGRVDAVGEQL